MEKVLLVKGVLAISMLFSVNIPSNKNTNTTIIKRKLLCHWGWDNYGYSQVIINKLGLFNLGGVYALYNKSQHVHHSYFVDEIGRAHV